MPEGKRFCPNCGFQIKGKDVFCPNCGHDMRKSMNDSNTNGDQQTPKQPVNQQPKAPAQPVQNQAPQQPQPQPIQNQQPNGFPQNQANGDLHSGQMPPAQKPKKHKFVWLIPVVIVLVILVGGYFGGSMLFGRSSQASSLANDMSSGDTSKMSKVAVDKDGNQLNASELKPLNKLYKSDSTAKSQVKRIIQNDNGDAKAATNVSDNNFKLIEVGKYLGIFPKYKVQLKPQTITIDTNADNPTVFVDGQSASTSKTSDGYIAIKNKLPGQYKITVDDDSDTSSKKVTVPLTGEPEYKRIHLEEDTDSDDDDDSDDDVDLNSADNDDAADSDTDTDTDSDSDDDYDSDDDASDSSDSSVDDITRDDLIGDWTDDQDNDFYFDSDGTYTGNGDDDQEGEWHVTSHSGDHITVNFNNDDGSTGGWSATFTFDDIDSMHNDQGNSFTR